MSIAHNIKHIRQIIASAERAYDRALGSVGLLAVSKKHTVAAIQEAYLAGVFDFGESYVQEALSKMEQLKHLAINWHFIGPIQSNKTKSIAKHFNWVHSLTRLKIANLLNDHRDPSMPPLQVCLHINLVDEDTKSGINEKEAMELASAIQCLPQLKLRGLMTIPPPQNNPQKQYKLLVRLSEILYAMNEQLGLSMDTLSMGMSDDLIPAIQAGSTIVRVGTAIFGARQG